MVGFVRLAGALFLSIAILQTGTGLFGTFLPVRMDLEAFSPTVIGLIGSSYFAGFILGSLFCDRLLAAVGHIRAFAGLAALVCSVAILIGLEVNPWTWGALRLVNGLCIAGLFLVIESWLNSSVSNEGRGRLFAFYMSISYTALGAGQFLVGTWPAKGPELFMLAALFYAFSLVPLALSPRSNPIPYERHSFGLRRLIAVSPLGMAGCLIAGVILGAFYSLMPVTIRGLGLGVEVVARFMGFAILFGLVMQWPLGKLSDIFDRRKILTLMAFAVAGAAGALALLATRGELTLLVLAGFFGATVFTLYPISVAHANDYAGPADVVPLTAGLLVAYGVGAAFGPTLAAGVVEATGPQGVFLFSAVAAALLGLFALFRMTRREAVPLEEQGPFVPLLRTSVASAELSPLIDEEALASDVGEGTAGTNDDDEEVPAEAEPGTVAGGPGR
ncbi:MAG TPA: MFS transporter [Alphaproteobacteria bacterium]|nr:MFS transporter [Alphaproteobacteria bacterium]